MAVIEILKRGKKFNAQFRTDDGCIDKIKGSWNSQQEAKRDMLAWQAQVKRSSIKVLPVKPLPEPEPEEEEEGLVDPPDDENLHARTADQEVDDDEDDDDEGDSLYTVGELMDMLKADLIELADSWELDSSGTKADIAQRIVDAQDEE
jgi:hypothetical protein